MYQMGMACYYCFRMVSILAASTFNIACFSVCIVGFCATIATYVGTCAIDKVKEKGKKLHESDILPFFTRLFSKVMTLCLISNLAFQILEIHSDVKKNEQRADLKNFHEERAVCINRLTMESMETMQ